MSRTALPLAFLALAFAADLPGAAPPARPTPSQIAAWVEQLGDDDFQMRERASARLRAAGEAAEPALEAALSSPDLEVKRRARAIVADLSRGIYPDTPAAVVELIGKYETVAPSEKPPVIRGLMAAGPAGCRALVRLARGEKDAGTRKQAFAAVFAELAGALPALLEARNQDIVESLLELAVQGDVKSGVLHFAAYHLLNGTLSRQIARLEREAKGKVVAKADHEALAYLHRANGDPKRALKSAKLAEREDLVEALHYARADWKALNALVGVTGDSDPAHGTGRRAAYARLSGDEKTHLALVKELIDRGRTLVEAQGFFRPYAKALFLNGRAAEAMELLRKGEESMKFRYDLLAARRQLTEAFALVEEARKKGSPELPALELAQAVTLHQLGEKERALAILKSYADKFKGGESAGWHEGLLESELAVGRRDEAFAVAAKALAAGGRGTKLFDKLFVDQGDEAAVLWLLLTGSSKLDPTAAMARLRALMDGKATKGDLEALVKAKAAEPNEGHDGRQWLVVGEVALRCKQEALAADCFRKSGTLPAALRLGDLEAAKQQWLEASVLYSKAYRQSLKRDERPDSYRENQPALALWLYGHALERAGMADDGRRRTEQAHLLPLGDGEMRYELMRDLLRRGHTEASAREQEYLRRLGEPTLSEPAAYYTGEGYRAAALAAAEKKEHLKAADGFEQSFLRVLHPDLNFARPAAYVSVPAYVFRQRAFGLAKAGKLDEARHEARRCAACLPGDLDLAVRLVPLFDAAGRRGDGDELFRSTRAVYESMVKAYPRAALAHNQIAWLSATCRRELETGLASARRAVELAPDSAAYHDTLAEVLFQMGKKDDAVAAQKTAVRLDPKRDYFRRQLRRLEAGDARAPRPTEEE